MGFMDKLKGAAKSAAKGAVIMAAHTYGVVTDDKYKGCKISMNSTYDKLTFIKLTEIQGEHVIKDDIKTFWLFNEKNDTHIIKIEFTNGDISTVTLNSTFNNPTSTNTTPTLEQKYRDIAKLVEALTKYAQNISPETRAWANQILAYAQLPAVN